MKNESIRKTINVDKPNYAPLFEFKELDNAVIRLSLFKDSVEFDITGQTVKLGAKTSEGLKEQSEGFTINKNNLDIDLKNSILVPGTVEIDLELKEKLINQDIQNPISTTYVGNARTGVFHRSGCRAERRMSESNRIYFDNRDELINRGFRPCLICKP